MTQPKVKNEQAPLSPRFVADDNGYAAHKIAWYDSDGVIRTIKVDSNISVGSAAFSNASGTEQVNAYSVDGVDYSCQGSQNLIDLRNGEYPTSVHNRVLTTHALTKAGLLGQPIRLAVTLPFRDYFDSKGMLNEDLRNKTQANFSKSDVVVLGKKAQPEIKSCNVYAEALAGWFDWALDDQGNMRDEATAVKEDMAVIDIGGSTTDICAVRLEDGALLINNAASGTKKVGVLDARHALDSLIRERLVAEKVFEGGHDNKVPSWFINMVLEKGHGNYYGKDWDMSDLRDIALKGNSEQIINFIKTTLGNLGHFEKIVIIGGGAIVFGEVLKRALPMAVFGNEFSNAIGAVKYLRGLQQFEG